LVSRDAVTLPLLEMSDKMRAKYQEQALKCKPKFLYQAIKLCNDCDQTYRTSRNKRLQVEICLIQASQLTEEDVPGAGRRPARILKPIFTEQVAKSQTAASSPVVAPKADASVAPQPQQVEPQIQSPATPTTNINQPKVILRNVSFKHFGSKNTNNKEIEKQEVTSENIATNKPLDDNSLKENWFAYVNSLPREQMAIAQRMRMLQPVITGPSTIEITVNSPQIIHELNDLKADMEKFLRSHLQNGELTITFQLAEQEELKRSYSKQEYLQELENMNPSLTSLINELKLEFD
jgi:DNA polymerase-3 subunit gamma/tau